MPPERLNSPRKASKGIVRPRTAKAVRVGRLIRFCQAKDHMMGFPVRFVLWLGRPPTRASTLPKRYGLNAIPAPSHVHGNRPRSAAKALSCEGSLGRSPDGVCVQGLFRPYSCGISLSV